MADGNARQETRPTGDDLAELVINCPELNQLETQLSQFNIFRVLKADRNELRHSNMLAWLFNPDESHGFDDLFLRRWLMIVLKNADETQRTDGWISPIAVDVLDIERVEIHREMENIDLLFAIHTRRSHAPWIICIENKVDSTQSIGQLKRYHDIVEKRYADAARRIYVFLTRNREFPEHSAYIESTYGEAAQVLDWCLNEREDAMGAEPRLLINHYKQLLVDDFMEESEASKLARQIYIRHRRALDYIFENKVDAIFEATVALEAALKSKQDALGIEIAKTNKGYIRFIPKEWQLPENSGGTAWGDNGPFLLCEVNLWTKTAELHVTAGKAPEAWADKLWDRAAKPPFAQEWKKRPAQYVKPYKARSDISVDSLLELDDEETGDRLMTWLEAELNKERFKQTLAILADLLKEVEPA